MLRSGDDGVTSASAMYLAFSKRGVVKRRARTNLTEWSLDFFSPCHQLLARLLTHSHALLLTHTLGHLLALPLAHSLTVSLALSFIYLLAHSLALSLINSLAHSLALALTHSHAHSLAQKSLGQIARYDKWRRTGLIIFLQA